MFYELLDGGHDPRAIDYNELATDWIRRFVLKKYELDCLEIKWLKEIVDYFCINSKKVWNRHRGKVIGLNVQKQHATFFDKSIDATILCPCNCAKCIPSEPSEMKQASSKLSKFDTVFSLIETRTFD